MCRGLLLLMVGVACGGPEYGFTTVEAPGFSPTDDLGDGGAYEAFEAESEAPAGASGDDLHDAGTVQLAEDTAAPATSGGAWVIREEHFSLGHGPSPVADFLFIIDDSVSMRRVLRRFRRGIRSMTALGVFPRSSRIAVMNTTPADPVDPLWPHPIVHARHQTPLMPGFMALMSSRRIEEWREFAPERELGRFSMPGCQPWFAPDDANAQGDPCLLAHSQVGLRHSRAEAGLVALRQWLEITAGQPRFREGAVVNVVFISDTHDPGLPPGKLESPRGQELLALQPDLAQLESWIDEPVAGFRLHAIAPATECGELWDDDAYFRLADEAGGVVADICEVTDYAEVIDQIAKSGARAQRPTVRLGYRPHQVEEVLLDGKPIDWAVVGQALELPGGARGSLTVRYRTRRGL